MDAPRVCPSCSAAAEARQRWCLECGAELPQRRRQALRPAVGIATTLAVLVGAASAGGYTLLRHDRQPPPPATTVAAQPTPAPGMPPATATPPSGQAPGSTFPSATPSPLPVPPSPTTKLPRVTTTTTPRTTTTTPSTHGSVKSGKPTSSGGAETGSPPTTTTTTPQLALSDVALGAAAVVYAPYASNDADLGDASRVTDGTTRTSWRTPHLADPTARPQLGVYVDLATSQKLRKLVLQTPTPGMSVEVYGARNGPPAAITDGGWDHLSTRHDVARKTTIGLPSRAYRYVLVWIVGLPTGASSAAISELSLLTLQPE